MGIYRPTSLWVTRDAFHREESGICALAAGTASWAWTERRKKKNSKDSRRLGVLSLFMSCQSEPLHYFALSWISGYFFSHIRYLYLYFVASTRTGQLTRPLTLARSAQKTVLLSRFDAFVTARLWHIRKKKGIGESSWVIFVPLYFFSATGSGAPLVCWDAAPQCSVIKLKPVGKRLWQVWLLHFTEFRLLSFYPYRFWNRTNKQGVDWQLALCVFSFADRLRNLFVSKLSANAG